MEIPILIEQWPHLLNVACVQKPPLVDAPLQLISTDPKAKDVTWEDDDVPVQSMDLEIF